MGLSLVFIVLVTMGVSLVFIVWDGTSLHGRGLGLVSMI